MNADFKYCCFMEFRSPLHTIQILKNQDFLHKKQDCKAWVQNKTGSSLRSWYAESATTPPDCVCST